jgi:hypothetical protein
MLVFSQKSQGWQMSALLPLLVLMATQYFNNKKYEAPHYVMLSRIWHFLSLPSQTMHCPHNSRA